MLGKGWAKAEAAANAAAKVRAHLLFIAISRDKGGYWEKDPCPTGVSSQDPSTRGSSVKVAGGTTSNIPPDA